MYLAHVTQKGLQGHCCLNIGQPHFHSSVYFWLSFVFVSVWLWIQTGKICSSWKAGLAQTKCNLRRGVSISGRDTHICVHACTHSSGYEASLNIGNCEFWLSLAVFKVLSVFWSSNQNWLKPHKCMYRYVSCEVVNSRTGKPLTIIKNYVDLNSFCLS